MKLKNLIKILSLAALSLGGSTYLTACGANSKVTVKSVDLNTTEVGTDTYVNMETVLVMGNLKFPNVEVPIINPKTLQIYGQMSLQSQTDGTNHLSISVDYQEVTKLDPSLGKTLPNGRELPLSLAIGDATIIGIPILQQSRIYIGGDSQKNLYIGAAIAIPALDSVLSQVPMPLNIFFNFPFSTQISSAAGLFTGTLKGENGVGVFVKRSALTPAQKHMSRMLTAAPAAPVVPEGGEELQHLNTTTLIRLDHLMSRHATLRVK